MVAFSWLISAAATKHAGALAFLVRFTCLNGTEIVYDWHTAIYDGITVGQGMNNGTAVVTDYSDAVEAWKAELLESFTAEFERQVADTKAAATEAKAAAVELDRRVTNLEAVSAGVSYVEEAVASVTYEAPIPTRAAPWAHLDRVGGSTTRTLVNIADFSTAVGTIDGVDITYDETEQCLVLNGTVGAGGGESIYGDFTPTDAPLDFTVKHIGGTMTGSEWNNLQLVSDWAAGFYSVELTNGFDVSGRTGELGNGIGGISFTFIGGTVFNNYKLQILAGQYALAENKPTALAAKGKNLVPFPYYDGTEKIQSGITWTVNEDGSLTANGTSTYESNFILVLREQNIGISAGNYTLSGLTGGSKESYVVYLNVTYLDGTAAGFILTDGISPIKFTQDVLRYTMYASIAKGESVNNLTFNPQLERGTTATAYSKPSQTISTTALPDLSDLEGWGQGVPSVGGNYITFTEDGRVLYQQTTYRYVLDGTKVIYNYGSAEKKQIVLQTNYQGNNLPLAPDDDGYAISIVCNDFEAMSNEGYYVSTGKKAVCAYGKFIRFYDPAWGSLSDEEILINFKNECAARYAAGDPIIIEYALATLPDPIDITDRFNGFDGFIEGEGNGSIVIENTAKADLPTTLTYMVSTRGA